MYLPYTQRRKRFIIEVTYASDAVRTYGPWYDRQLAEAHLRSRMIDAMQVGSPRSVAIKAARVRRSKRLTDYSADGLLGVRLYVV